MNNIWEYAAAEVENPSIDKRVAHSSLVKGLQKRGSSTSGAMSTVRDGAQAATGAIPIPVIGSFISSVIGRLFSAARAARLKKKFENAQANNNNAKFVKFGLKLLDADSLDRKRAKVEEAYQTFKGQSTGARYKNYVAYAQKRGETCHPLLEKAKNIQYAMKHIDILQEQAAFMTALGAAILEWSDELKKDVVAERSAAAQLWKQNIPQTAQTDQLREKYHKNCLDIGGYCVTLNHLRGGSKQPNKNVAFVFNVATGAALDAGALSTKGAVLDQIPG